MNELTTIKFNKDGDQIISSEKTGAGETQTVKYGLIKLMGDKKEYRVSFKTLVTIENARQANFKGTIKIPELHLSVLASQIVMLRSETEKQQVVENFTKLPTESLCLDFNLKPLKAPRVKLMRDRIPHYEALVHFTERDGERQYYLEFDKIKRCMCIEFEDVYSFITSIYEYGVENTPSNAK